jgi:hypothetical protein
MWKASVDISHQTDSKTVTCMIVLTTECGVQNPCLLLLFYQPGRNLLLKCEKLATKGTGLYLILNFDVHETQIPFHCFKTKRDGHHAQMLTHPTYNNFLVSLMRYINTSFPHPHAS